MARIALLIGIDDYRHSPLQGCVADAMALTNLLEHHDDGTPNFECRNMLSSTLDITRGELRQHATELFSKPDAELAIFYFAGHGLRNIYGGHLVTPDHDQGDEGVPMEQIIGLANASPAAERVIILDCCHAGAVGDLLATQGDVPLAEGVSILVACRATEPAAELVGRGLFTSLICDALAGGAADVTGSITLAGLYAYVDEVLSGWDQRPLFKANVSKLSNIRRVRPAVSLEKLRRIVEHFPSPDHEFGLDTSYEPTERPRDEAKEAIFQELQQYRAARLLEPTGNPHMYYEALNGGSCHLTPLGRFYWHRVTNRQV